MSMALKHYLKHYIVKKVHLIFSKNWRCQCCLIDHYKFYIFILDNIQVSTELYCVHESQLNRKSLNLAFIDNQFIPLIPKNNHLSSIHKDQLNKDFLIDTIPFSEHARCFPNCSLI